MTYKTRYRDLVSFREEVSCMTGCPINTDSGMYVQQVARGEFEEGYLTARSPNPFASSCGRVCAAPCEDSCRRGRVGEPISIRSLKKFLCEGYGPETGKTDFVDKLMGGTLPASHVQVRDIANLKKTSGDHGAKKVAIIGAGPAGLSAAHDLALLGYSATVFESLEKAGGMMRYGIPPYRLPDDVLDSEVAVVQALGVELKMNHKVTGIKELMARGFEAVFIGVGAMTGRMIPIEGKELEGVHTALEFLVESNSGKKRELGKKSITIGGGLVALDAARDTRRIFNDKYGFGNGEVHLASLEAFQEMPANMSVSGRIEVDETLDENIELHNAWGPKRVIGANGKVTGMELVKVLSVFDAEGKFNPKFDEKSTKVIDCDSVIFAIGQASELSFIKEEDNIELTPRNTIKIDDNFMTSMPGVFSGGDIAFGPRNMIDAISHGKKSAIAIDEYLNNRKREKEFKVTIQVFEGADYEMLEEWEQKERQTPVLNEPENRTGLNEVELSFTESEAVEQASRCLTCHTSPVYDGNLCILCSRCTDICPEYCLQFVPASKVEVEGGSLSDMYANLGLNPDDDATILIKNDDACIRCGLCAIRCPTGAITMERIVVEEVPVLA